MRFRTWHAEWVVVALVLIVVNVVTQAALVEWVGAAAVLLSFGHAAVADRMAERQARMAKPDVECYYLNRRYFVGKELLWVAYFIIHHSYAALVGCAVFVAYPVWRGWYRSRCPLGR